MIAVLVAALLATPQDWAARGNEAWKAGRYIDAVAFYQKALALRPRSPELLYNLGTALFRTNEFSRALNSFEDAAREARRGPVAALSRYNAGNSAFQVGLTLVASDPKGCLGMLERALDSYAEALRLDASLADARHNADVVRRWLKILEEQFRQQGKLGGPPGPGAAGPPGPALADGILRKEAQDRSGATRTARPPAVEKDW